MTVDTSLAPPAGTRHEVTPAELSGFPAVGPLLERLGVGPLVEEGLAAYPGRNDNWAGETEQGAAVFVKHLGGDPARSLRRFRRVLAFERLAAGLDADVPRPRLIGSDEEARLLVFDLVDGAATGSELAADDRFGPALAHRAGRVLAGLHALWPPHQEDLVRAPAPLPPQEYFHSLPWSLYSGASAATLEAWRLLQGDSALHEALRDLRRREQLAAATPVHGDIRLDQLLLGSDGRLLLADWEEFRLGDPAHDLGAFAGDWLYRAVLKVPGGLDHTAPAPAGHDEILRTAVAELARVTPLIAAFAGGYTEARPDPARRDPDLAERATAFAGWHLLDRLLAGAGSHARLTPVERAAAGVGRTALLTPRAFVPVLGWEGTLA